MARKGKGRFQFKHSAQCEPLIKGTVEKRLQEAKTLIGFADYLEEQSPVGTKVLGHVWHV